MEQSNKKINVLMSVNNCRDYAFCEAISKSEILNKLYIYGNNKMASKLGEVVETKASIITQIIKHNNIDLVILFNEAELIQGISDIYKFKYNIPTVGTTKDWMQLEASKIFSKKFMHKYKINTPDYFLASNEEEIIAAIKKLGLPVVIKCSCLAAGFGTYIAKTADEAINISKKLFYYISNNKNICINQEDYKFLIIEKFINGEELTLMSLWDGHKLLNFLPVKDFKKLKNGNMGINTGGMGAYTPVNISPHNVKLIDEYNKKLEKILKKEKANFTGFIYTGAMFLNDEMYVLEYNMRPGDPEGQALIKHLNNDILYILYKTATSELEDISLSYKTGKTGVLSLCDKDYANSLGNNDSKEIVYTNIDLKNISNEISVFYGKNVEIHSDNTMSHPIHSRVLNLSYTGNTPFKTIYKELDKSIKDELYYRTDLDNYAF